jgi:hypothetical protein
MPQIPLVNAPIPQAAGNYGVRANPGMFDGVNQANARLGDAVAGVGELAVRVKRATDTAYVIGAQTKLEAAQADFQTWTKTQPDTSTWQDEHAARMQAAVTDVDDGGKNLAPDAQLHLKTLTGQWQTRGASELNRLATNQNIINAQGTINEAVDQSITSNDVTGAHAAIDNGVATGIIHPNMGVALKKKVTVGVATNQANAAMEQDPFTVTEQLTAKDDGGNYVNFQGLPQAARATMQFRASKLANETRAATVREWATQIRQAQDDGSMMPDEDGVRAEAARQGIAPKTIDRLYAVPKVKTGTDAKEFAETYSAIMAYSPGDDPTKEHLGEIIAQAEGFKGIAHDKLSAILTKKLDPHSPSNKPAFKAGVDLIDDAFKLGVYGSYRTPGAQEYDADGKAIQREDPAKKQKAQMIRARNLDAFNAWVEDNPEKAKSQVEITKFVNGLNAGHATDKAASTIINFGAFGLGK